MVASCKKEKAKEPSSESAGVARVPRGSGVRTLLQGYGGRSGEEEQVGLGFQYSFLLGTLKEQVT